MINCKALNWIDRSRVNPRERKLANAFVEGGYALMKKLRLRMNKDRSSYEKAKR